MKKIIALLLALVVLSSFMLFAVGSGESSDNEAPIISNDEDILVDEDTTDDNSKNYTLHVRDVITTDKIKLSYLSTGEYTSYSSYSAPKSGYEIIYINVTAENVGTSDIYISTGSFHCYADDVAMESYYCSDGSLSATISSGRSATGKVYFEVPVDADEIEIEYELDYLNDSKAILIVK